jgi:RNA-binding protein YhbY
MLERLTQRNPSFRRALEECSENSGKVNLRAYLGAPKDRVPRYHAFLLRMLELYSPQDPEYVGLVECIQSIECINVEVTKMIHVVEQREAVFWIQHSMVGYTENLVTETRRLVYQGEVIHVRLVDAKQEERKAFLFNDLLILARQLQDGTHEFKTKINIRGARACELQDGPKSRNMLLIKTADGEDYFIQTESPEARRRWYHHLREVTDDPSLFDGGHNQTDLGRSMLNQTTALGWSIADDVEDSVDVTHVLKSPDHTNDVHQLPFLSTSPTSLRSPSHGSSKYGMDRSNTRSSRKKSKPKAAPSFERQRAAKNGAAIFTEAGIYVTGTPTII